MRVYALDTGALLDNWTQKYPKARFITTVQVIDELENRPSIARAESLQSTGRLIVSEFPSESLEEVRSAALSSGDAGVLSETDLGLLALAQSFKVRGEDITLVSTDLAVLNVARKVGIRIIDPKKRMKRQIAWVYKCPACGRSEQRPPPRFECPVCGTSMKRRAHHMKKL